MNKANRQRTRRAFYSLRCGVEYQEVPKVACTSVKATLLASDGLGCRDGDHAHTHPHWDELPPGWKAGLVFTIVRHPLDRLVSAFIEKCKTGKAKRLVGNCQLPPDCTFADWCQWVCKQKPTAVDRHWKPQHLVLNRKHPQPDLVMKLETISDQWQQLQESHGLPDLLRMNQAAPGTRLPQWWLYYTPQLMMMACDFYQGDLEAFDYSAPDPRKVPQ